MLYHMNNAFRRHFLDICQCFFNFKIYKVTTWETNNYDTHIANISISKGNQTLKFGQLIEYDMRNIFLEHSYTKCGLETSPRPFS